ncbi:chitosanase [Streptomyces hokutonensis]|uniref:chitosanase n=1 Tax=Streptomyces hokutonensis TaxID=1306990 RepID=UPI0033CF6A73
MLCTAAIASPWPSADASASGAAGLDAPAKKDLTMRLVSSVENSSLDWEAQYRYIEDIGDGRGCTGGIIGFCSGTSDMLALVELYTKRVPHNVLAGCLPALRAVNSTASRKGPAPGFSAAWHKAARTSAAFREAQRDERDRGYFDPAVARAKSETTYLDAFLDARVRAMNQEKAHSDVTRVGTAQPVFLREGDLDLGTPLKWKVCGDSYTIG